MNKILTGAISRLAGWLSFVPNKIKESALESQIAQLEAQLRRRKERGKRDAANYHKEIVAIEADSLRQKQSAIEDAKALLAETKTLHRAEVESLKLDNTRLDGELTIAKQFLEKQQELINWHQQTIRAETAYQAMREVAAIGGDADE